MAILGATQFVIALIQMFCFCYNRALHGKRLVWFDAANNGAFLTQISEGVDKVEARMGEQAGLEANRRSAYGQYDDVLEFFLGGLWCGVKRDALNLDFQIEYEIGISYRLFVLSSVHGPMESRTSVAQAIWCAFSLSCKFGD